MGRIYSRANAVAVEEDDSDYMPARERPMAVRHAMHETRDAEAQRPESLHVEANAHRWINPSSLDAPQPRQGFVQRWIADEGDSTHWMKKMREGWSPRDPATLSERDRQLYGTAKTPGGQDVIRVAKNILCELPIQVARARKKALDDLHGNQLKAIPESTQELRKRGGQNFGPVEVSEQEFSARGRQSATMVD